MRKVNCNILWNDYAVSAFRFPIKNPVRISISRNLKEPSVPSEFLYSQENQVEIGKSGNVNLLYISVDYFNLNVGDKFIIGRGSQPVGEGTVLKVLEMQ